jgi:hypothetical protein
MALITVALRFGMQDGERLRKTNQTPKEGLIMAATIEMATSTRATCADSRKAQGRRQFRLVRTNKKVQRVE